MLLQPCQGWGRGFESHRPLQFFHPRSLHEGSRVFHAWTARGLGRLRLRPGGGADGVGKAVGQDERVVAQAAKRGRVAGAQRGLEGKGRIPAAFVIEFGPHLPGLVENAGVTQLEQAIGDQPEIANLAAEKPHPGQAG